MSASSNQLEASIAAFLATKEGDVASSPSPSVKIKDRQIGILFAIGEVRPLHPPCIYLVALSASSDALEASIALFSASKEGNVASSPSPFVNNQRSANRVLFAIDKVLPFVSPLHIQSCNKRF